MSEQFCPEFMVNGVSSYIFISSMDHNAMDGINVNSGAHLPGHFRVIKIMYAYHLPLALEHNVCSKPI